ncbi:MAG TPA: tetratricopeptide repeat protein [Planctomycetota bacterium]|nr:tetratricopeptide repeat protein [Planctomycetota bacterium]
MTVLSRTLRRALPLALSALLACDGSAPGGTQPSPAQPTATQPADPAAFEAARARAVHLQDSGGDPQAVLDALLAAHRLNEQHPGINRRLAVLYSDLKLYEPSLHHFQLLHDAQPDDHDALLSLVTLQVRLGQLDAAMANLPPLLADQHLAGEGRYQQATILDLQGRRPEAEALVADLSGLSPEQAYRCFSLRGRYEFEKGDMAAAAADFAAALSGRPDYKEALRGAADSARRLGHEDEARRWDEVLELFVDLTDNVFINTPKAAPQKRAALEKLVAAYPAWGKGFLELADMQAKAGEKDAACATMRAYLAARGSELAPGDRDKLEQHFCGGGS